MKKKCPVCNGCMDMIWVMPRRFYRCWFCKEFYDIVDNKSVVIDVQKIMNISKEELNALVEQYEQK